MYPLDLCKVITLTWYEICTVMHHSNDVSRIKISWGVSGCQLQNLKDQVPNSIPKQMGRMLSLMLPNVCVYSTSLPLTYIHYLNEALGGGSATSHINHDTAIQQPKSEQARNDSYALHQEVQSVLCRTFELERRMGIVRNDRSVCHKCIQLG